MALAGCAPSSEGVLKIAVTSRIFGVERTDFTKSQGIDQSSLQACHNVTFCYNELLFVCGSEIIAVFRDRNGAVLSEIANGVHKHFTRPPELLDSVLVERRGSCSAPNTAKYTDNRQMTCSRKSL